MKLLNNRELHNLDQELFKFRGIDKAIWTRKAELMAKNGDDFIGSKGGGVSKPTENMVMKFATDVPLKNLELFKETVETFKKQLTGEQLDIFYYRYSTLIIANSFIPPGALNSTTSPSSLPINALAIGDKTEILDNLISASSSPTIWYLYCSFIFRSSIDTVAPKMILPSA